MRPPPGTAITLRYGSSDSQVGNLYLPNEGPSPVLCLFHGGFWRYPYGKDQMDDISRDLVHRGYAIWNMEYRRVGEVGGGWPGTLADAFAAIDFLAEPACGEYPLDLSKVMVIGHSAGGHLALLSCLKTRPLELSRSTPKVMPIAVASLAGITDLIKVHQLNSGDGSVEALLGGSPDHFPDRFHTASPMAQLPISTRQLILHGTDDTALPIELSRHYAEAARRSGDEVQFIELAKMGHMEYLDPSSEAHEVLCKWLTETLKEPSNA
jgi:acetyl esterase/lipase